MARDFVRASSHRMSATGISPMPVTNYPFTLSCWINIDVDNVNHTVFGFGDSATNTQDVAYLQLGDNSGAQANISIWTGGAAQVANMGATRVSTGTWTHIAATAASTTSRQCFQDGVAGTEDTDTLAFPSSVDQITIGAQADSSVQNNLDGKIAECALWDVALTDDEMKALAGGVPANMIRRTALVGYWPLWGAEVGADMSGSGNDLTNTGSTVTSDHPPVGRYARPPVMPSVYGAASLGSITASASQSGNFAVTKGRVVYLYNRDTGLLEQTGTIRDDGTYEFNNVPNVNAQEYYTVILDD